jgi:hypothetical protein
MRRTFQVLAIVLILAIVGTVSAQIADPAPSPVLAYEGRLVESNALVTGTRPFVFSILDSNGNELWNSGAQILTVVNGLYGVVLGTTGMPAIPAYMAGARYRIAGASPYRRRRLQPFAQLLVGTAHAGGGIVGRGDGSYAFASRVGGGIDMPVSSHIAIRIFQIDYYLTHFANLSNDHQNNLLLGAGIVLRWG